MEVKKGLCWVSVSAPVAMPFVGKEGHKGAKVTTENHAALGTATVRLAGLTGDWPQDEGSLPQQSTELGSASCGLCLRPLCPPPCLLVSGSLVPTAGFSVAAGLVASCVSC